MKVFTVFSLYLLYSLSVDSSSALPSCSSRLRLIRPEWFTHCAKCQYDDWSAWEMVPNSIASVPEQQCRSGEVYSERRRQTALGDGCIDRTESRHVCMPDQEDRFIMALGLGSSGHDYTSLNSNPPTIPTARPQPRRLAAPYRPRNTQAYIIPWPVTLPICQQKKLVCHEYTVSPGKRSLREEKFGKRSSRESPAVRMNDDIAQDLSNTAPLPFNWNEHHTRFRRQTRNCGAGNTQYILFLLDTSGSIGRSNFIRMTNAISVFSALICKPVKIAAMTFNHEFKLEFCFDCFDNDCDGRRQTKNAIKGMQYRAGQRHTAGATECACSFLLSASCGLPADAGCIDVVYITDGGSSDPTREICDEVECLHNRFGVNTYAMGIGRYERNELQCISSASTTTNIFSFETFDEFVNAMNRVVQRIIDPPPDATSDQYQCIDPQNPADPDGQSCFS